MIGEHFDVLPDVLYYQKDQLLKGYSTPKNILSLITYPHVVPNP